MTTPILQATKSCSSQLNNILLNRPPFGGLALGLASLASTSAEVIYLHPEKERRQKMTTQRQAMGLVAYALKTGKLTRATICETCGVKPAANKNKATIIGHHWQGYDKPLNVLWVCQSCNNLLRHKHDGSLNLEQAKLFVRERQRATLGRKLNWFR